MTTTNVKLRLSSLALTASAAAAAANLPATTGKAGASPLPESMPAHAVRVLADVLRYGATVDDLKARRYGEKIVGTTLRAQVKGFVFFFFFFFYQPFFLS
jgi:hypothetical protein